MYKYVKRIDTLDPEQRKRAIELFIANRDAFWSEELDEISEELEQFGITHKEVVDVFNERKHKYEPCF